MTFPPGKPSEPFGLSPQPVSSSPPPIPPLPMDVNRRQRQNRTLGIALLALLVCLLLRTQVTENAPGDQEISTAFSQTQEALKVTKEAFAQHYAFYGWPPSLPSVRTKGTRSPFDNAQSAQAILAWYRLANARTGTANDWRRLGITLFLFGRAHSSRSSGIPSGLDALRRAVALSASGSPTKNTSRANPTLRKRLGALEEPQAGTPAVSASEEAALWQAIYGMQAPSPAQARMLGPILTRLGLGWFENIAAAEMYARAGMRSEAHAAAARANESAQQLSRLYLLEVLFIAFGTILLLIFGARALVSSGLTQQSIPPPRLDYDFATNALSPTPASTAGLEAENPAPPTFSYRARMVAFMTYLGAPIVLWLPLLPLRSIVQRWSPVAAVRMASALTIVASFLIAAVAVMVLRRLVASEAPDRRRPSLRATLSALGLRSRHPLADLGAGVLGYSLVLPPFYVAAWLSTLLFHRFHTPVHPVEINAFLIQSPLDRLLILIETSLMAPLVEETMFRGLLYPGLRARWGTWAGMALSSAIFALVHPTLPGGFLPLFTLGFGMALAYERRGSLLPGIVMHSLNNTLFMLISFAIFAK